TELEVDVGLAQLVLEPQGVERVLAERVEVQIVDREPFERRGPAGGEADLRRVVEVVPRGRAVDLPVDVGLLQESRSEGVDAVVDAPPEYAQGGLLDEGDVVLGDELAAVEPVVVDANVGGVAVLDELPGRGVRSADQVLGLRVTRYQQ